MKKLLGILVLGLLWCNVGVADDSKFSPIDEMYKNCTSYIKLISSENPNLNQDEKLSAILCNEFFKGLDGGVLYQGIITNMKLSQEDKKRLNTENILGSCMNDPKFNPEEQGQKLTFIKTFVRYVEDNPKKIKEMVKSMPDFYPVTRVLYKALQEKYPCE